MKKLLTSGAIAAMLVMGSVAFAQTDEQAVAETSGSETAEATTATPQPVFPIAELGNCDSKAACHTYCEDSTHRDACFAYAQTHGLMSKDKIAAARVILGKKGPGGCSSADSCRTYCSDSSHQEECMKFAQEKKIISDDKVSLIKRLTGGEGPGACKSSESCKSYCTDPAHLTECKAFAMANNLRPKMGSTTPPMMRRMGSSSPEQRKEMEMKMRIGSTTRPGGPGDMPRKLSSTTPDNVRNEIEMRMKNGSSSGAGEMRKPMMQKPPGSRPEKVDNGLGAALLSGFMRLIGF